MKKLMYALIFALTLLLLVACNKENANVTETTESNIDAFTVHTETAAKDTVSINGETVELVKPQAGAVPEMSFDIEWGSEIELDINSDTYSAEEYKAIRTVVSKNGQWLVEEDYIDIECVDSDTVRISHEPFGDIWLCPSAMEDVYVRYQLVTPHGSSNEYKFQCKSSRPTAENSSILKIADSSLSNGSAILKLSTLDDTDGDGVSETIALYLTEDYIPFIAVNGKAVTVFRNLDESFYEYAELKTTDLNGDSFCEIFVFWNSLGAFNINCTSLINGKWTELFLPSREFSAKLQSGEKMQLTLPNGSVRELTANDTSELKYCFDDNGEPYSKDAEITCLLDDKNYTIVSNGTRKFIEINGSLNIRTVTDMLGEPCEEEWQFLTIPMYISMEKGKLCFDFAEQYIAKTNLYSYIRYLVNYFHDPYTIGEEITDLDILALVFQFCHSNQQYFDFATEENATLKIDGEGLRKTGKLLFGEDFEAADHHELFEYGVEKYDAETDIYSVPTAKDYWGGELVYIKFPLNPEIKETETKAEVTVIVHSEYGAAQKFVYEFDKVVNDNFLFYRLKKVTAVEVSNDAVEKSKAEAQMLADHLIRFVMKPEAIDPYYEFTDEDIFRFLCSLPVYRDEPAHPYGDMVKTDESGEYYIISLEDAKCIAYEVFDDNAFSPNSYPTKLYDEESDCYRLPKGAGLWTTQFAYEDMTSFERDGLIYAECHLVNSELYEYPKADYGIYHFSFEYSDVDKSFITLKRIIAVG